MYDWIPMEFDYDILIQPGGKEYAHYHCIARGEHRELFTVWKDDYLVLSTYSRAALVASMEIGSKINGMTKEELMGSYEPDNNIDISSLI